MPTVRKYGNLKVGPAAPPAGAVAGQSYGPPGPATFGEGLGNQIQRFGESYGPQFVAKFLAERAKIVEDADQLGALRANNEQANQTEAIGQEVASLEGWNALGAPELALDKFDKSSAAIAEKLTSDRQRELFNERTLQSRLTLLHAANTHMRTQVRNASVREYEAGIKVAAEGALKQADLAKDNPTVEGVIGLLVPKVETSIQEAVGLIALRAFALGDIAPGSDPFKNPILLDQANTLRSQIQAGVIDRLLATPGHEQAAKAYFETVRHQLTEDAETRITEVVAESTIRSEGNVAVEKLLGAHPGDLPGQLTKAREIYRNNTDLLKYVVDELKVRENERRDAKEQAKRAMTDAAFEIIDRPENKGKSARVVIPPAMWKAFEPDQEIAVTEWAERNFPKAVPVETNEAVYNGLLQEAFSLSEEEHARFMGRNLADFSRVISRTDLRHLQNIWETNRTKGREAAAKLDVSAPVQGRMVDAAILGMRLDPNPPQPGVKGYDPVVTERVDKFRRRVRDEVRYLEQREGRPATDKEVQVIVDELAKPTTRSYGGMLSRVRGEVTTYPFEATPLVVPPDKFHPVYVTRFEEIPFSVLPQIKFDLAAEGIPYSPEQAIIAYNGGQQRIANEMRAQGADVTVKGQPPPPVKVPKTSTGKPTTVYLGPVPTPPKK